MIIRFNKKIYSQESVQKALKDFEGFGLKGISPSRTHYCVDWDETESAGPTDDEFKNYVLYLNLTDAD